MKRASRVFAVAALLLTYPVAGRPHVAEARTTAAARVGTTLGVLSFPTIAVKIPVLSGVDDSSLARGLGLMPGTAVPGDSGNAVVAGHRTSHGAPMRNIDRLKVGDSIYFTTAGKNARRFVFRVTKRQVVKADAIWITRPTAQPTLTIFACHPPHSIAFRYVVFAKLVTASSRTAP